MLYVCFSAINMQNDVRVWIKKVKMRFISFIFVFVLFIGAMLLQVESGIDAHRINFYTFQMASISIYIQIFSGINVWSFELAQRNIITVPQRCPQGQRQGNLFWAQLALVYPFNWFQKYFLQMPMEDAENLYTLNEIFM